MPDIRKLLDQIRDAKAQLEAGRPGPHASELLSAVGAPPTLRPGARVRDTVTGEEGEVISYGRGRVIGPAPGS